MGSSQDSEKEERQQRIMAKMYLDRVKTGDVTFVVQSKNIRAHKCVLAAVSPIYHAQFYGLHPDEEEIVVRGVYASEFEEFLQHFYLDKPELSVSNVEGVLILAKQLQVDELVNDCVNFLVFNVDVIGIGLVYRLGHKCEVKQLEEWCLEYISHVTEEILKSDEFLSACNREMLHQIVKMNSLNCKETEVFETCISWAKRICSRKCINDENMENLRTELGGIVYEIRFHSMTYEEFNNLINSYPGFLTPDEIAEIIYMFARVAYYDPQKFSRKWRNEQLQEINRNVHEERINEFKASVVPVTFTCNKAIRFKGFATGFTFDKNQSELEITITSRGKNPTVLRPKYKFDDRETSVLLDETIDIAGNDLVEVKLCMQQSPLVSTKYTLTKMKDLDDLHFVFSMRAPAQGILLTKLFFFRQR